MDNADLSLRKWVSNEPQLLMGLPADHVETTSQLNLESDGALVKTLGLYWSTLNDSFYYKCNLSSDVRH